MMTMKSIALPSSSSCLLFKSTDLHLRSCPSTICSSSSRSDAYIPKLEPFNRSKMDRWLKPPPPIERSKEEITDYCLLLEGDDCLSCWTAYRELQQLEKEMPKEEVESIIRGTEGVESLIKTVHFLAYINKKKKEEMELESEKKELHSRDVVEKKELESERGDDWVVPDGLPRSEGEMDEEEKGRMPDSPFTRLLRSKGKFPAWFTPRPDHETD